MSSPPSECPICYNDIGEKNNCTTECGHVFCLQCIVTCLSTNKHSPCPICRTPIDHQNTNIIENGDIGNDDDGEDEDDYDDYDEEENEEHEYDMDYTYENTLLYPLNHSRHHINNLLRLDRDATSSSFQYGNFKFTDAYCYNKYRLRRGVLDALGELTDAEWKHAQFDILKSIAKHYGKANQDIWEEGETLGLANEGFFTATR
jgi:hypothetical protein